MENQNEPSQTSPESIISQSPNPLPRRSPDRIGTKAGSFLTNKLFLITVIILILFAITYAGIYLSLNSKLNQITKSNPTPTVASQPSPTPDPTANWKIYKDTSLNIEFKYPNDWKVEKINEGHGLIEGPDFSRVSTLMTEVSPYKGTFVSFVVSLESHNPKGPLLDYFKDLTQKVVSMHAAPNDNISTIYIGGREAVKWDTHNQGFSPPVKDFVSTRYYVLHKGKFFQISKAYSLGKYEETFDQILSTFQFTK